MAKNKDTDFFTRLVDEYGDQVVFTDSAEEIKDITVISTGSISLNASLGIGGIPKGKISILYGPESSGKTGLALCTAKQAIDSGGKVLYIDVENMLDLFYAKHLVGTLDKEKFIIVQPNTAEDAFTIAETGINSGNFDLIVFDSIGSLAPEKEKEDDFTDANVALVPRLLSKFLRRNAYSIRTKKIAFVFINQVRDTIGSYVSSYSTPGGHALRHYASIIVMLSKIEEIKAADVPIGIVIKFTVKKNKLAPPYRSFTFPFLFDSGIDTLRDLLKFGETIGHIQKAGPYYKFGDMTLGRGMVESIEFLKASPETLDKILKEMYNTITRYEKEVGTQEDS